MQDQLLSPRAVASMTSLSRTTLWRLVKSGDFPAPLHLSPGRIAWSGAAINAWVVAKSGAA